MGVIAPAFTTVNPSLIEPDIIMSYSQMSGAFELLPKGMPRVKLGEGDLAVYVKRLDLRTKLAAGQAAYNMLPNVELVFSYGSTPTYLTRCRAEWDHHDSAATANWGIGLPQGYRLGMRQAHFQFMRSALLYGVNPSLGEGVRNAPGSTAIALPPDAFGNSTIQTYDNGSMALFLLQLIGAIKTRTNNLGTGRDFTILGPQRVLQQWSYNIVQLTSYQRPGGGTESTAGTVKIVGNVNDDNIKWVCDDTLIGKGDGGTDLIIFVMPELELLNAPSEIDTNEFRKITPGLLDNLVMYTDMVAPREITVPLPGGAVDVVSENRISSGWPLRPEAITLLSATY